MAFPLTRKLSTIKRIMALLFVLWLFYISPLYQSYDIVDKVEREDSIRISTRHPGKIKEENGEELVRQEEEEEKTNGRETQKYDASIEGENDQPKKLRALEASFSHIDSILRQQFSSNYLPSYIDHEEEYLEAMTPESYINDYTGSFDHEDNVSDYEETGGEENEEIWMDEGERRVDNISEKDIAEYKEREDRISRAIYNDIHVGAKMEAKNEPQSNETHKRNEEHIPSSILLLSSMGRSGSSFLGGLLKSLSNSVYFFEPFHGIEARHLLNETSVVEGLKDIFTCNIKKPILSSFAHNPRFYIKAFFKQCQDSKYICLSEKSINSRCNMKSIRIIKTIRTRIEWLKPIFLHPEINLRIIHLVRDPRASIISGWDRNWDLSPKKVCDLLSDDLREGLKLRTMFPGSYMAVRYEDLCDHPYSLAKQIFAFLGYSSLPASTISFIKASTTSTNRGGDAYGIMRNTKTMAQKWRTAITEDQLKVIEDACGSVISQIGFELFRDLTAVRNDSVPLYNNKLENNFFTYDKS